MIATLIVVAFYVGVVAYSAAATLFFVELARPERTPGAPRWAARALAVGVAMELLPIAVDLSDASEVPSIKFALMLCSMSIAVGYLVLRVRMRIDAIGVVVAPLSLALLVGAQFLTARGPATDFPHTLLLMHVAANVLGVGFFLLAGAAGGFYLFQERRLKAKRAPSMQGRLPPLEALDMTEHRLLLAGFPLLTFGIVSGAVFAARLGSMTSAGLARSAFAYATWLLVAGVLILRAVAGWRGRRSAYGTLAGVVCVVLVVGIYVVAGGGGL
ncbi:MAG TPA: cytochrome c biogenesis protein CcsA [Polyangiaceae bacterium]|jgi:ABC-type uncharacterized transport system permease subunit|nr:cytochrome c biogenesis protein CcsA [Polyangiaceae bacterium]